MKTHVNTEQQIALPDDVLVKARGRARSLGMTLSEYMKSLVDQDVSGPEAGTPRVPEDPWRQPVPPEVNAQWEKDLAEFEEEDQQGLQPSFDTVEELIDDLDA